MVRSTASRNLIHLCWPVSYRNPACLDMCSKCYRERAAEDERTAANGKAAAAALSSSRGKADSPALPLPRPAAVSVPAPEEPAPEPQQAVVEEPAAPAAAPTASSSAPGEGGEQQRPVQKNPGRCFTCNKRVGLTGFKCRCDYVFCSTHRHVGSSSVAASLCFGQACSVLV